MLPFLAALAFAGAPPPEPVPLPQWQPENEQAHLGRILGRTGTYGALAGCTVATLGLGWLATTSLDTRSQAHLTTGLVLLDAGALGVATATPLILAGPVVRSGGLRKAGAPVHTGAGSASVLFATISVASWVGVGAAPESSVLTGPLAAGSLVTAWILAGVQARMNNRAEATLQWEGRVEKPGPFLVLTPLPGGVGVAGVF